MKFDIVVYDWGSWVSDLYVQVIVAVDSTQHHAYGTTRQLSQAAGPP
jgi:hypothetical protein